MASANLPEQNRLILVTGNPNKSIEAERILGIPLLSVSISLPEVQAATVEEITHHKVEAARTTGHGRFIVEDVSLGFDALGNFPGPYIRWLLEAAGGKGLGAIAAALEDRSARARCCVGYWNGSDVRIFTGEVPGEILAAPRGRQRFGWDAWFVPRGSGKTFAEMTDGEKDAVSHRGAAYRMLAAHLAAENARSIGRQ